MIGQGGEIIETIEIMGITLRVEEVEEITEVIETITMMTIIKVDNNTQRNRAQSINREMKMIKEKPIGKQRKKILILKRHNMLKRNQ